VEKPIKKISGSGPGRVLIVEDDPEGRAILKALLQEKNFTVLEAATGKEGLRLFQQEKPDLVILDIGLPDLDGLEVCRRLRKIRHTWLTPIIFLTGRDTLTDKLAGLREGVVDYITKPYQPQELLQKVENTVRMTAEYRKVSTTDGLTGVNNYNSFQEQLHHHFQLARRYGTKFSLLLADIDGMKEINDAHGHLCGDLAIRETARRLKKFSRRTDLVFRYGGDEFALILPLTDEAAAEKLLKRLREKTDEFKISCKRKVLVKLSFGLATFTPELRDEKVLFARADRKLYREKRLKKHLAGHGH